MDKKILIKYVDKLLLDRPRENALIRIIDWVIGDADNNLGQLEKLHNKLREDFDFIVNGDSSEEIDSFKEMLDFLANVKDTSTLENIVAELHNAVKKAEEELSKEVDDIKQDLYGIDVSHLSESIYVVDKIGNITTNEEYNEDNGFLGLLINKENHPFIIPIELGIDDVESDDLSILTRKKFVDSFNVDLLPIPDISEEEAINKFNAIEVTNDILTISNIFGENETNNAAVVCSNYKNGFIEKGFVLPSVGYLNIIKNNYSEIIDLLKLLNKYTNSIFAGGNKVIWSCNVFNLNDCLIHTALFKSKSCSLNTCESYEFAYVLPIYPIVNSISKDVIEIKEQVNVLNQYQNYEVGHTNVTSISKIPTNHRFVIAKIVPTETNNNFTFSLDKVLSDGRELHVIGFNESDIEMTISFIHENQLGVNGDTLVLNPRDKFEVNVISDGATNYIRFS